MDRNGNWRRHHDAAREHGCWCANERKPCGYHEGYVDGHDSARAGRPLNDREPVR